MAKFSFGLTSAALLGAMYGGAAEIAWTVRPNTCSDSDVRTEGRCLYAYTPSTTEVNVNGVQFCRWTILADSVGRFSTADFADDASFDTEITRNRSVNWLGDVQTAAWTGGEAYRTLLQWAWYSGSDRTLTLKGLTAGKRYLVQIWMCDARNTLNTAKKLTLGSATGDCYSNGFGCNFIGTFTADGETQDIFCDWSSEPNFTAFQVRCLDEAHITWTSFYTSGESDVRTDGSLAYAYKGGETMEAGGTIFFGRGSDAAYFGPESSPDITFSPALGTLYGGSFCESSESVPNGAYSYSAPYLNLIGKGYYMLWTQRYSRRNVTLRNLKPGLRYLVQMWVCDNRSGTYDKRTVVVGNGVVLSHSDGVTYGHGSTAVGTFTATSTEQTFSCYHRSKDEQMLNEQEMIGPIQVRCLDADYEGWIVGDTKSDGSVDTRGWPLYAYCGMRTEVAGTVFRTFTRESGDQGGIAIKTNGVLFAQWATGDNYFPFIADAKVGVSPAVTNLLGGGLYNSISVNQTVELQGLVPGRRYLVQAWFMDTRNYRHGTFAGLPFSFRIVTGDVVTENNASATYRYDKAPLGQYVTGIFRATGDTFSIPYELHWGQLNAIQVRVLDSFIPDIVWECSETKAGYDSVSTEGTKHCAYAPVAFEANGVAFDQRAPGSVDIGGDGNIVLRREFLTQYTKYADESASPLFKNGWFNYTGADNGGLTDGNNTVTLGNLKKGYSYLVQLFVADLRDNPGLNSRWMSIGGWSGNYGPTGGKFNYGAVFTGRFAADSSTKSFDMTTASSGTAQLNAIQVREIGPAEGVVFKGDDTAVWSSDGAGWIIAGEDQANNNLWGSETGKEHVAVIDGDAMLSLSSDVTACAVYGSGNVVIGEAGTQHGLSVLCEIHAPTATVNAVWNDADAYKTYGGVMVLAGDCPRLRFVTVSAGRLVLDGQCPHALDISVNGDGELGFSNVRQLGISSLSGDGTLTGPGGIILSSADPFTLPSGIRYADGFCWSLENGSTLVLPDGFDASAITVRIDNPAAYDGVTAVTCMGAVTRRPKFVYGAKGWRAVWSQETSGWTIKASGLSILIR